MNRDEMIGKIENLLFASGDSMPISGIAELIGADASEVEAAVAEETVKREDGWGLVIKRFDDRLQLSTRSSLSPLITAAFGRSSEEELTRAMLETLSIVAYRQPVTRAEIEEIRGVNTSYMLSTLMERGFICEAGRRDAVGRPILYATAEGFLRHFGISDLSELPPVGTDDDDGAEDPENFEY